MGAGLDATDDVGLLDVLVGRVSMPVGSLEPELGVIELIALDPTQSMRPRTGGQSHSRHGASPSVTWLCRHRGVQAMLVGPAADVASLESRGQQLGERLGRARQ